MVKGLVTVELTQAQAAEAGRWLLSEYAPSREDAAIDKLRAFGLGKQLSKAAKSKRKRKILRLEIPRRWVQWLASFAQPLAPGDSGGGAWIFGRDPTTHRKSEYAVMQARDCPPFIAPIAAVVLRAASRRMGRRVLESARLAALLERPADPVTRYKRRAKLRARRGIDRPSTPSKPRGYAGQKARLSRQ